MKVEIKYNPYKLETEILINGAELESKNSLSKDRLRGKRLQEWGDNFPKSIYEKCNSKEIEIDFIGTEVDFEDLEDFCSSSSDVKFLINHIKVEDTRNKITSISQVMKKIQNGPFEELKSDKKMMDSYQKAINSEFEISVIATMSSGKSTLINALLNKKLMPSKNEACTAIITKIKDVDGLKSYNAKVYDKEEIKIFEVLDLNLEKMNEFNYNENVSKVEIDGELPFVSSQETSLVLVDTPGPNNARDKSHAQVLENMLDSSSKALVLFILSPEFAKTDEENLLKKIAKKIQTGGKVARDRFLFVVNKVDNLKEEDGNPEEFLNKIRSYLSKFGIDEPHLFPVSALSALNIRLLKGDEAISEREKTNVINKVKELNDYEEMHFEKFSTLPNSIKDDINKRLEDADNDNEKALIHSGIISLEMSIQQYIEKYAKTAKIKNIIDTFWNILEELNAFENTKKELVENEKDKEANRSKIKLLENKINDGSRNENFKKKLRAECREKKKEIIKRLKDKKLETLKQINDFIDKFENKNELDKDEYDDIIYEVIKGLEKISKDFNKEVNDLIVIQLKDTSQILLISYKKELASLTEDSKLTVINIEPLKFVKSRFFELENLEELEEKAAKTKIEIIKHRKLWNPLTWLKGDTKKKVTIFNFSENIVNIRGKSKETLDNFLDDFSDYTGEEIDKIQDTFDKEIDEIEKIITKKLKELEVFTMKEEYIEDKIKENKEKLDWLNEICIEVDQILELKKIG